MTATVRLPRMLSQTVKTGLTHQVDGESVSELLGNLFLREPGLRNHIVDESGGIRPHVSVFVDGTQADLATRVGPNADIRILHAVSGGSTRDVEDGVDVQRVHIPEQRAGIRGR